MSKPSILHICLSQGWGGLEMYPTRTGKAFLERGYAVYGLCLSGTHVAKEMRNIGIEAFEVSSKRSLMLTQILHLSKWLKERNVSIIHCHKSGDILVSALLDIFTKRKTLFTEHMGVTRPKRDIYHRLVYWHIDHVLSISNETYKRNLNALPISQEKISRLWLGTDIPLSPIENPITIRQIKNELGLPCDSIVIGNIGRVCHGKGQMELLESFALLKERHSKLHLLLVGGLDMSSGSDESFVSRLKSRVKELSLESCVHLTGFRKDTDRMLSAMDVVCLPNHNEAFGLTAIEAMAAQKAIVAWRSGALPEILGSTALICPPFNEEEMSLSIESYLNNKSLLRDNAIRAYERAQQEFSMTSHILKLEKFYCY